MKAVFLSDAHLKKSTDERYGQLLHFFSDLKEGKVRSFVDDENLGKDLTTIDDLFILGDFFDFWFCNPDKIYPEFRIIIDKLVELRKSGIRIHFCEGNHDFFMKDYFLHVLQMEVLEDWADIQMDGLSVLASHGDTANPSEKVYLMFRKILRSRLFYHVQRLIPASLRWVIASTTSNVSKEMNNDNRDVLVGKMRSFAEEKFARGCDVMILGHCHKPVLEHLEVQGKKKTFVTLGDWVRHYSFLYYENGSFYLSYYPPR